MNLDFLLSADSRDVDLQLSSCLALAWDSVQFTTSTDVEDATSPDQIRDANYNAEVIRLKEFELGEVRSVDWDIAAHDVAAHRKLLIAVFTACKLDATRIVSSPNAFHRVAKFMEFPDTITNTLCLTILALLSEDVKYLTWFCQGDVMNLVQKGMFCDSAFAQREAARVVANVSAHEISVPHLIRCGFVRSLIMLQCSDQLDVVRCVQCALANISSVVVGRLRCITSGVIKTTTAVILKTVPNLQRAGGTPTISRSNSTHATPVSSPPPARLDSVSSPRLPTTHTVVEAQEEEEEEENNCWAEDCILQRHGLRTLCMLASDEEGRKRIVTAGAFAPLTFLLGSTDPTVHGNAAWCLAELCEHDEYILKDVARPETMKKLVEITRQSPSVRAQVAALWCMFGFATDASLATALVRSGVLQPLGWLLMKPQVGLQLQGLKLLYFLSLPDTNHEPIAAELQKELISLLAHVRGIMLKILLRSLSVVTETAESALVFSCQPVLMRLFDLLEEPLEETARRDVLSIMSHLVTHAKDIDDLFQIKYIKRFEQFVLSGGGDNRIKDVTPLAMWCLATLAEYKPNCTRIIDSGVVKPVLVVVNNILGALAATATSHLATSTVNVHPQSPDRMKPPQSASSTTSATQGQFHHFVHNASIAEVHPSDVPQELLLTDDTDSHAARDEDRPRSGVSHPSADSFETVSVSTLDIGGVSNSATRKPTVIQADDYALMIATISEATRLLLNISFVEVARVELGRLQALDFLADLLRTIARETDALTLAAWTMSNLSQEPQNKSRMLELGTFPIISHLCYNETAVLRQLGTRWLACLCANAPENLKDAFFKSDVLKAFPLLMEAPNEQCRENLMWCCNALLTNGKPLYATRLLAAGMFNYALHTLRTAPQHLILEREAAKLIFSFSKYVEGQQLVSQHIPQFTEVLDRVSNFEVKRLLEKSVLRADEAQQTQRRRHSEEEEQSADARAEYQPSGSRQHEDDTVTIARPASSLSFSSQLYQHSATGRVPSPHPSATVAATPPAQSPSQQRHATPVATPRTPRTPRTPKPPQTPPTSHRTTTSTTTTTNAAAASHTYNASTVITPSYTSSPQYSHMHRRASQPGRTPLNSADRSSYTSSSSPRARFTATTTSLSSPSSSSRSHSHSRGGTQPQDVVVPHAAPSDEERLHQYRRARLPNQVDDDAIAARMGDEMRVEQARAAALSGRTPERLVVGADAVVTTHVVESKRVTIESKAHHLLAPPLIPSSDNPSLSTYAGSRLAYVHKKRSIPMKFNPQASIHRSPYSSTASSSRSSPLLHHRAPQNIFTIHERKTAALNTHLRFRTSDGLFYEPSAAFSHRETGGPNVTTRILRAKPSDSLFESDEYTSANQSSSPASPQAADDDVFQPSSPSKSSATVSFTGTDRIILDERNRVQRKRSTDRSSRTTTNVYISHIHRPHTDLEARSPTS